MPGLIKTAANLGLLGLRLKAEGLLPLYSGKQNYLQ
jgi:hypothetical protein